MARNWKLFGEAKRRWVPTQEGDTSHAGYYLEIMPIRSPPAAVRFAIGAASSRPQQRRGLPIWQGRLRCEIRP